MIKKLAWGKVKFKNMQIGAYNLSIRDLAKLESLVKEEVQNTITLTVNLKSKIKK